MALSTIGTAGIADDAITSAKVDSTTAAFTVADLVVTNGITAGTSINAGTELVGNVSGRILLDASAGGTDVGDEFLLNATDASASNDGSKILFEEGTDDVSVFLSSGLPAAQLGTVPITNLPAGSVVQLVHAVEGNGVTSTSGSYASAYTEVFTPTSADNKVMVICSFSISDTRDGDQLLAYHRIRRTIENGTVATVSSPISAYNNTSGIEQHLRYISHPAAAKLVTAKTYTILDEPATTRPITYDLEHKAGTSVITAGVHWTFMEIVG
jgi:hypothetical protein